MDLIDVRLTTLESCDLRGLPRINYETGQTEWMRPEFLPEIDTPVTIFLDELTAAEPRIQASVYQLILDRCIGKHRIPDHRLFRRCIRWRRIAAYLRCAVMLVAARRYVKINVFDGLIGHIRLAEVARVGADLLRLPIKICRDLRDHRDQLLFVVRLLRGKRVVFPC
jgi:hypothetical protein